MTAPVEDRIARLEAELARCQKRIAQLEAERSDRSAADRPAACASSLADLDAEDEVWQEDLARFRKCSKRTLRRMVKNGELPKPVKWGARRLWTAGTLRAWFAAREAHANQRDAALRVMLDGGLN